LTFLGLVIVCNVEYTVRQFVRSCRFLDILKSGIAIKLIR
jgi:hypothetical protein